MLRKLRLKLHVVNREIDTLIQKVEYRRTQLLACLKQDTESVMRKLADEKYQVEEVQKMFNLSLHTAISSLVPRREPGHKAMQLLASQMLRKGTINEMYM